MFGRRKRKTKVRTTRAQRPAPGWAAERELRSHFAGRRTGRRSRASLRGVIQRGPHKFRVSTVDLSCTGALIRIEDPSFDLDIQSFSLRVAELLGEGFQIQFGGGVIKRRMDVVRATEGGLGGAVGPLIACRFGVPLDAEACKLLGIATRDRNRHLQIMLTR